MKIKILGTGCKNCNTLYDYTCEVVEKLNLDAQVEKVTNLKDILSYGVMKPPALVVDEKVVVSGRVPSKNEIEKILK
ncbi:thioredoxin family protein [Anaeromicrobium sediminis]|uniref:Redox-active disulfide protein 2 n=1 Tax=Anaeromicrobium sediminis TaxID=1478221 RepID=A0A267MHD9_9FIRM|nr:thioredoxin family protein [Anaeromicrobium sediminis]PAB58223.1 redox-active disulfide protein 2 [Anaeromicrobium sediminis]